LGQQDVGHSGVAAGRGDLSLSSLISKEFGLPLIELLSGIPPATYGSVEINSVADASLSVQKDLLKQVKQV
jgi:hypothetical protein